MSGFHEEDPLGKSYDWRLLLRLLRYLRPYRGAVAASFLLILAMAALDLAGPYLTKVAIDRHISRGDGAGLLRVASLGCWPCWRPLPSASARSTCCR